MVYSAAQVGFAMFVLLGLNAGCGDNKYVVSPANGKVVCGGQPVTTGSVVFTPVGEPGALEAGKSATAAVGPDGTFTLTTFDRFDGAIIGQHTVQYVGSEGEEADSEEESPSFEEGSKEERDRNARQLKERKARKQTHCVQKQKITVEVKADGENNFTIELSLPGK